MKACATRAGAKFPEVVAAQWALESARGTILSGKNNFFGIKGQGTVKTTWEDYGNGAVIIKASFKDFATPYDCVDHLVTQWYKDYKGYKGVNRARTREECARLLKAEGYATDPIYSQKLISLMNSNEK
jgi:flagellum-specific peptidoglycan hydrolase FlgJ